MSQNATGTRILKSWDEKDFTEADGRKLTSSAIAYSYTGAIEGDGVQQYVMFYRAEDSTTFVGLEQIVGRLGGRSGSFVLQHTGELTGDTAEVTWTVVPGSGTGELAGLTGTGGFTATHEEAGNATYRLDYSFE
ncbi:DUF3224 domain-containing protein [Streptomyces hygroscopicus subsp. hygroscopicus]|uniref:DUF3224 domain-containing protein n=1 Tax=Streptomyces hygroscopicus TaxID=1912 RepID=UPI0007DB2A63|nr:MULTISPECIES: DUF3224 domain-containing protein [Streptomyces]MBW8088635.1 DUF3224 domain-containing protein [Streptomyces hygroscopicus subsp. hygroscopicus]